MYNHTHTQNILNHLHFNPAQICNLTKASLSSLKILSPITYASSSS